MTTDNRYQDQLAQLRLMQLMAGGDDELFLQGVAVMLGQRDDNIARLRQQISDDSWITNPDRQGGGGWTAEELDPNRGWK
jgi:hypothetical protein